MIWKPTGAARDVMRARNTPIDPELVKAQQALNDLNNARLDNLRIAMRPRMASPRWFVPRWLFRIVIEKYPPMWILKLFARTQP